jgi:hypothetical protein
LPVIVVARAIVTILRQDPTGEREKASYLFSK